MMMMMMVGTGSNKTSSSSLSSKTVMGWNQRMALPLVYMVIMAFTAPGSGTAQALEPTLHRRVQSSPTSRPNIFATMASDAPSNAPSAFGAVPSPSKSSNIPTAIGAPSFATSVPTPAIFSNSSSPTPSKNNSTNNVTKPSAPTASPVKPSSSKPSSFKPSSLKPSLKPSPKPSLFPTTYPSDVPSGAPTVSPSIVPSSLPSSKPSVLKTDKPSESPTSAPSQPPSVAPTNVRNNATRVGQVNVVLSPVNQTMDSETLDIFRETTTAFFSSALNTTLENVTVIPMTQRLFNSTSRNRYLAESGNSVFVPLEVRGVAIDPKAASSTLNLNSTLSKLVTDNGDELVKALQETPSTYLKAVKSVSAVASLPTSPPVSSPTVVPNGLDSPTNPPAAAKKKGLSTGIIIGIAVAGGVFVLIVLLFILIRRRTNSTLNRNTSDNVTFTSMPLSLGDDGTDRRKPNQHHAPPPPPQDYYSTSSNYQQSQSQAAAAAARQRRSAGAASQSSMADTQSDYGSELMGTDNHSDRGDNTAAGDTMSYTYSLDAGLTDTFEGTSIISGNQPGSHHAPVPTSIPHITKSRDDDDDDGVGMLDDDDDDLMELGSVASSTLVGATGGTARVAEQYITRECWAPPGKLGIVIDTTLEGPVVHKVNPGSPLEGMVWPGDIIIAIDNVDTRAMSASAITQLMIKTAKQRRKLTILSDATTK